MIAILNFAEYIVLRGLDVVVWIVIAYAILSWLIAFNIVNTRNTFVYQVSRGLQIAVRPLLWPFQRIIPSIGGLDFSPILLFLVVGGAQSYLIPPLFDWLRTLAGGPVV